MGKFLRKSHNDFNSFNRQSLREQTKQKGVETSVSHVFIDKEFFIPLCAVTQQPHKILVLKFNKQHDFILKLSMALP